MTNLTFKTLSLRSAIAAAIADANLANNSPRCVSAEFNDGLWELEIRTIFMKYDIIVDACSREILGMNAEPATDTEDVYEIISIEPDLAA